MRPLIRCREFEKKPWCHVTYGPNSDWIIINWQLSNQSSIRKSRDNKVEWIYLNTKTYSVILSYQNKLGKKLKIISKKMFNPGSKNCDYPIKNSDGYYCLDYRFRELINYSIKVKSRTSNTYFIVKVKKHQMQFWNPDGKNAIRLFQFFFTNFLTSG